MVVLWHSLIELFSLKIIIKDMTDYSLPTASSGNSEETK